jgi:hypothetical protein
MEENFLANSYAAFSFNERIASKISSREQYII